ncbi:MAG: hypothetical protein FVQ82_00805 [Planctomycetes bacterium]|nr:hypothetical protein [Planctomycetota bacterium]
MRVLVITEEDEFYIPPAISHVLENSKHEIVGVVCARNPIALGKFKIAKKIFAAFGFVPILTHVLRLLKAKVFNAFPWLNFTGRKFSVKNVCRQFDMPYMYCDDLNSKEFLDHCRQLNIDLIASVSPSQIFKEDLINLPKHGCINIHTAKLPKYKGLYPTYWAMAHGDKTLGISIHYIEKGIDTGKIIVSYEVEIPPAATMDQMLTLTKIRGAELLLNAVDTIASGQVQAEYAHGEGSYFSFPTRESYKDFKSFGYKLW